MSTYTLELSRVVNAEWERRHPEQKLEGRCEMCLLGYVWVNPKGIGTCMACGGRILRMESAP